MQCLLHGLQNVSFQLWTMWSTVYLGTIPLSAEYEMQAIRPSLSFETNAILFATSGGRLREPVIDSRLMKLDYGVKWTGPDPGDNQRFGYTSSVDLSTGRETSRAITVPDEGQLFRYLFESGPLPTAVQVWTTPDADAEQRQPVRSDEQHNAQLPFLASEANRSIYVRQTVRLPGDQLVHLVDIHSERRAVAPGTDPAVIDRNAAVPRESDDGQPVDIEQRDDTLLVITEAGSPGFVESVLRFGSDRLIRAIAVTDEGAIRLLWNEYDESSAWLGPVWRRTTLRDGWRVLEQNPDITVRLGSSLLDVDTFNERSLVTWTFPVSVAQPVRDDNLWISNRGGAKFSNNGQLVVFRMPKTRPEEFTDRPPRRWTDGSRYTTASYDFAVDGADGQPVLRHIYTANGEWPFSVRDPVQFLDTPTQQGLLSYGFEEIRFCPFPSRDSGPKQLPLRTTHLIGRSSKESILSAGFTPDGRSLVLLTATSRQPGVHVTEFRTTSREVRLFFIELAPNARWADRLEVGENLTVRSDVIYRTSCIFHPKISRLIYGKNDIVGQQFGRTDLLYVEATQPLSLLPGGQSFVTGAYAVEKVSPYREVFDTTDTHRFEMRTLHAMPKGHSNVRPFMPITATFGTR